MPLHPSVVHLPLGLSLVLPLVALFAAWRLRRGERHATFLVLVLAVMLFVGNIAARQTGEEDEELVEKVVAHAVIERHEEAANLFAGGVLAVLVLAVATVALGAHPHARTAAGALVIASVAAAALAVRTGHEGGAIVYEHNGARVHAKPELRAGARPAAGAAREEADD